MRRLALVALFVVIAGTAVVRFTTYADAGITPTIPVDEKAMKAAETGAYSFDKAHSFIGFKVKHMGLIEVPGFFRDFTGTVNYDSANPTKSSVEFTAKVTSVDTGVAGRDRHLRTADFFDVEKFPDLTFKSTKVEKKGKGWIVSGDLTMRGVTKPVSIPFEITGFVPGGERSGAKIGIAGETTINRRDFGVNYGGNMPSGGPVVADQVKVVLQIEAGKPGPPRPASE
ncbi:MAG TPA: YceI family protein [Pyrinomonadaceae bacterium]|nr:YceI family protein [Pyrinomonadaceae bacterium]